MNDNTTNDRLNDECLQGHEERLARARKEYNQQMRDMIITFQRRIQDLSEANDNRHNVCEERRRLEDYYKEQRQALLNLDHRRYYELDEKIKRLERWLMSFTYR